MISKHEYVNVELFHALKYGLTDVKKSEEPEPKNIPPPLNSTSSKRSISLRYKETYFHHCGQLPPPFYNIFYYLVIIFEIILLFLGQVVQYGIKMLRWNNDHYHYKRRRFHWSLTTCKEYGKALCINGSRLWLYYFLNYFQVIVVCLMKNMKW